MTDVLNFGSRKAGPGQPVFVIAEIGVNHEGDFDMACRLVEEAHKSGADSAKFQIVFADTLYPKAEYGSEFHVLFKKAEFSLEQYAKLKKLCDDLGMVFFASFNDRQGVDWLTKLGAPLYKIASTQMNNIPLVCHVAEQGKPAIMSTGMAGLGEIEDSVNCFKRAGNNQIMLLHCVSSYPTAAENVNLLSMDVLADAFDYPVGFSDHYDGSAATLAAVARGACAIERHFTLDKTRPSFDHRLSSEPEDFAAIIRDIRAIEKMFGVKGKNPNPAEDVSRFSFRTSLAAGRDIKRGEKISLDMLTGLRPGTVVPTRYALRITGAAANRDYQSGELFAWSDVGDLVHD